MVLTDHGVTAEDALDPDRRQWSGSGALCLANLLKVWATRTDMAMADLGQLSVLLGDMDS